MELGEEILARNPWDVGVQIDVAEAAERLRALEVARPEIDAADLRRRLGDQERAAALLRTLIRPAPPYAELGGPWRFALCAGAEFFSGEVALLKERYGCREVELPGDLPAERRYRVLELMSTTVPRGEAGLPQPPRWPV